MSRPTHASTETAGAKGTARARPVSMGEGSDQQHTPPAGPGAAPDPWSAGSDAFTTARTKLLLWTLGGVRSGSVHIDTTDGLVTLYGKLPSGDQRTLAGEAVASVAGVRGVRNLLQVVSPEDEPDTVRSDQELRAVIEEQLRTDPVLKDGRIWVKSVEKGMVLLAGEARSYAEHLRACACVDRFAGATHAASEVTSPGTFAEDERLSFYDGEPTTGWERASDTRICFEVKLRLLAAPHVPSMEVSVDCDGGVVTLFGIVPTDEVKLAAGAEVAQVAGVHQLNNQLEVVQSASKERVDAADSDVAVDLGLLFEGRAALADVTPVVNNGAVLLTGSVESDWDDLYAVRLARSARGVRAVESRLEIRSAGRHLLQRP